MGPGSVSGVDTKRFSPNSQNRLKIRQKYDISSDACVILFVGRIVRDKGLRELVEAFTDLCAKHKGVVLMLIGPDDEGLMLDLRKRMRSENHSRFIYCGLSNFPEKYMAASDIFCLPSYR